ncbi:uncharacterized protein [Nicotiana sylvestris]|uniref:uncharacterized protein n=1 Tax=Nicotiana sylvestris TaxID=4096 RepID=UPI00388CACB5
MVVVWDGRVRSRPLGVPGKRKVNIACVHETGWAGTKARNVDGYKLWYSGVVRDKNGVGILVDRDLRESVVEVRRVNDRLMFITLVIGECILNVVSTYAPQAGLDEEVKRRFWEGLDEIVRNIPPTKRLFIGVDFNGHIGAVAGSYGEVHGGFGFGDRNGGGTSLLDFAKAFELVIANSTFPKREEHLVTFRSSTVKTQIDYLLLRRCDRGLCQDCKVIPGESLATQHRLLVMDIGIMMKRKKRMKRMPEEWRSSTVVPLYKNKGDIQCCDNYRGIKLLSHTMKVWERVVEVKVRKTTSISDN